MPYASPFIAKGLEANPAPLRALVAPIAQLAVITALAGCAAHETGGLFDYGTPAAEAEPSGAAPARDAAEKPKARSASALLGSLVEGPGYAVQPSVSSDGRYHVYEFKTAYGDYSVVGDDLARRHIGELVALDRLRRYSATEEFLGGVGKAITNPVKGIAVAVSDPPAAAQGAYANIKRRLGTIRRGASDAGQFITSYGHVEKRVAEREKDNILEKIVSRPKARRRLARSLGIDPYTHFVPLADELDKVASFSSAGEFGAGRAIGLIPGVGGTIVSGIGTLSSLTDREVDLEPDDRAAENREKLKALGLRDATAKALLLTDKLTPVEKTLAVNRLAKLSGIGGLETLADLIAVSDTRQGAYAALRLLEYVSLDAFRREGIAMITVIEQVPVVTLGDGTSIALLSADELAWTAQSAGLMRGFSDAFAREKRRGHKEIWLTGTATPLALRGLRHLGWKTRSGLFPKPAST